MINRLRLHGMPSIVFLFAFTLSFKAYAFQWPLADPEDVNMDADILQSMTVSAASGDYGSLDSVLIVRHGKLIYEEYFRGYSQNRLHILNSVTKSVGSALIGIALYKNEIPSVNEPLSSFFPTYLTPSTDPRARNMTLEQLLQMRHGLAWDEWVVDYSDPNNIIRNMLTSDDWIGFVLAQEQTANPGSVFRYSTGVANLMSGIITQATGEIAANYAMQELFTPLNFGNVHWEITAGETPMGGGLTVWPNNITPLGHGLWLRPRDMAKLGQLYLDKGIWQGRRYINENYIHASFVRYSNSTTDPQIFQSENSGYGYQWWLYDNPYLDSSVETRYANGWGRQFIITIPEFDMLVISTASDYNYDGPGIGALQREFIYPSVLDAPSTPSSTGFAYSGTWYEPATSGQGFNLEILPDSGKIIATWFTYEVDGGSQQWMIAVGDIQGGRAVLEFLRPQDGQFDQPKQPNMNLWGTAEIVFTSCTTATLSYHSDQDGIAGEIELKRLSPNILCNEELTKNTGYRIP